MVGSEDMQKSLSLRLTKHKISNQNVVRDDVTNNQAFFRICKFVIYIVCIISFVLNSLAIFKDHIRHTTVISTKVMPPPNGLLESPTLIICNTTAFKDSTMNTSPDEYKNNTINWDDVFVDVYFMKGLRREVLNVEPFISIKEDVKEIATMLKGTCFLIQADKQLEAQDAILLELRSKFDLNLYVINPGDEVFVYLDMWANFPIEIRLSKNEMWTDIKLTKKSTIITKEECNDNEDYVYVDCIKEQFHHLYHVEKGGLFSKCSFPWIMDLTEDSMFPPPCNKSEATEQSMIAIDFFLKASAYKVPNCKEPCLSSEYTIQKMTFDGNIGIVQYLIDYFRAANNISNIPNTKLVTLAFPTTDVQVSEEIRLNSVSDFISSVGGNLGLFIGFSFLSMLMTILGFVGRYLPK